MSARILVAEDDARQAQVLRMYLESEGYSAIVVHDGRSAIDAVRRRQPDLLVLDVMMPNVDGLDVCRILRQESTMPVLMLTARSSENDLLLGLDLGADDYMTKPYSPRELMARIRTLLRRVERAAPPADGVLRVGAITVDPLRHEVWGASGQPVTCTRGEFSILSAMVAEPGRVFTRPHPPDHRPRHRLQADPGNRPGRELRCAAPGLRCTTAGCLPRLCWSRPAPWPRPPGWPSPPRHGRSARNRAGRRRPTPASTTP
ncbi:MAG TPA: response regulator transcription factor [Streptomyces sp.]|nr:response regulator transcription factor [Streptomyces sp.]HET6352845.1 response regulator transcription factor [Streptomyces sp.]